MPRAAVAATPPGAVLTVTVVSPDGAPVADAEVRVAGTTARTDRSGAATLACAAGDEIAVRAARAGFEATELVAACPGTITVRLAPASLTSIGGTHVANSRVPFNTSAGSVAVISRTQIEDQQAIQFNRLLDQTPGAVSAHTGSSNPAAPGAQTSPNLRGTLDYEKTTLIDGHPIANGSHGDYVTTFLTTYLVDGVEIAKGPGADAPVVVNGIGGSINFRTREPSRVPTAEFDVGTDGNGGFVSDAMASTTIGRLGFLVDAVDYGTPGPFTRMPTTITLPAGSTIAGFGAIKGTTTGTPPAGTPAGAFPVPGALGNPSNAYTTLTACCEYVDAAYQARGELVKARWRFSDATSLTAAYLGTHAVSDNDGATLQSLAATFAPSGTPLALNPTTHLPANQTLTENEPMLEAELRTAASPRDTVVARWYALALDRFTGNAVAAPGTPYTGVLTLTGSAPLASGGSATFNGTPATVTIPNVYSRSIEENRLHGGSVELDHAAGPNLYTLALDRWSTITDATTITTTAGAALINPTIPAGSRQVVTAGLARAQLSLNARDDLTLAGYLTSYASHFATARDASGVTFGDATVSHVDPRLGFTHRFTANAIGRFAVGSTITPPNIGLVSVLNTTPAYTPGATSVTVSRNAGDLRPETAFGYDLGADLRLRRDTVLSFDAYETTLRNQFATTIAQTGTFTPPGGGTPIPLYTTANANIGNARFYGLETSLRSDPRVGFGWIAQGALVRSYAYDVAPSLYATATSAFGTNLAVIPGINYTSTGTGFNGYSNKGIPYADGYGEVHFRGPTGGLLLLGATYYGPNNSWNQRAFTVGNASLRLPIGTRRDDVALQFSVDNLWNTYPSTTIATAAGQAVPLANGSVGLVNALPVGPRVLRVQLHVGNTR
ncbi:MAG: TonB-dependent receptor plug domain-containing protein [Candidatus Eremiobacteraeota bacterium]|nr:TonB-dependent receptor plug domain-containing protein [Candidatus Eremiobacteraeota bacterium]